MQTNDYAPASHYLKHTRIVQYDPRFDHMRSRDSLKRPRVNPIAYVFWALVLVGGYALVRLAR